MKSAYELAMEKLGSPHDYSERQKAQLAEIEKIYEAKKAETKLIADEKLKKSLTDPVRENEIRKHTSQEIKNIEEEKELKKEIMRESFKAV